MKLPVGGDRLELLSAGITGCSLELVFRWNDNPDLLGMRFEIPDTTEHPAWTRWAPQMVEEWVQYAVRVTLIEEMQTCLLHRACKEFDGRVLWLHSPDDVEGA